MKIRSTALLIFVWATLMAYPEPISSCPPSKIECNQNDAMTGKLLVGEYGYFERDGCHDIFSLNLRRLKDRERFWQRWHESKKSGTFSVPMTIKGELTGEVNSLGRPIYEVTEIIYID